MRVNLEDQPTHRIQKHRTPWLPYAVLATISALTLTGFAFLYQKGWGITINLNKLSEAITVNGSTEKQKASLLNSPPPASQAPIINHNANASRSDVYIAPPGKAPINWEVKLAKFNSVYVRHPSCNPNNMQWTQMDCSNFRARAMKRFQKEWAKNSYWNGHQVVENKSADIIINSELSN